MAVNVKMGVDLGGFKSGIQQGTQILKGLNAEMKATEAEFKATGNAEQALANKTKTLNSQIQVQKGIIDQAQKALKAMKDAGVEPTDKAYQAMYATMMKAQTGMYEAQAALNEIGTSAQQAAVGADKLTQSVGAIGKKVSLDAVISGIDRITSGLEKAAQKAVQLGQTILNEVRNAAKWADDTVTMAQSYDIPLDRFLRMQKLVQNGMDTSVENMLDAMDRLNRGVGSDSKNTMDTLTQLGLVTTRTIDIGFGLVQESGLVTRDATQLFWQAGQAMMKMGDTFDKEAAATALFGRSWKELVPLFSSYKNAQEYEEALAGVTVNSEETVTNLAELNEKLATLQGNFDTLKTEVMGALAPALSDAADALSGLLTEVINYLQTEKGQEMLQSLSDSVSSLFSSLGEIDPESVVESFTTVFNGLVNGLKWIVDNEDTLIGALGAIVTGWGTLKITGGVLDVVKLVSGIRGMSTASASAAGTAMGTSWGTAFASAVMKAAPWLIALYTLLKPSDGSDAIGNNTLIDKNGNMTNEAAYYGFEQDENGEVYFRRRANAEQAAQTAWDLYRTGKFDQQAMIDLKSSLLTVNELNDLMSIMYGARQGNANWKDMEDLNLDEWLAGIDEADIPVKPVAPEGSAEELAQEIGVVELPATFVPMGEPTGRIRTPRGWVLPDGFANGLSYVPYDGMLARLHKGERVVPAREAGRNFSSNLYVENMNMNGGLSADALASAIASRNRRVMAGYGS